MVCEDREKEVIRLRYGDGDKELKEIAELWGISKKNVWKVEARALRQIGITIYNGNQGIAGNGNIISGLYKSIFGSKSTRYIPSFDCLSSAINTLPDDRMKFVLILCCSGYSTEFVGGCLGISKTHVCRIRKDAIRLLRHASRRHHFLKVS
jgi:DNA-directed RNA polymerase specialized sigma subunit